MCHLKKCEKLYTKYMDSATQPTVPEISKLRGRVIIRYVLLRLLLSPIIAWGALAGIGVIIYSLLEHEGKIREYAGMEFIFAAVFAPPIIFILFIILGFVYRFTDRLRRSWIIIFTTSFLIGLLFEIWFYFYS